MYGHMCAEILMCDLTSYKNIYTYMCIYIYKSHNATPSQVSIQLLTPAPVMSSILSFFIYLQAGLLSAELIDGFVFTDYKYYLASLDYEAVLSIKYYMRNKYDFSYVC